MFQLFASLHHRFNLSITMFIRSHSIEFECQCVFTQPFLVYFASSDKQSVLQTTNIFYFGSQSSDHSEVKETRIFPESIYNRSRGDDDDDFDFGDNEWENVFVTAGHATQRNRQKRQMYEAAMVPKIEWGQKGKVDKSARKYHQIVKYRQAIAC